MRSACKARRINNRFFLEISSNGQKHRELPERLLPELPDMVTRAAVEAGTSESNVPGQHSSHLTHGNGLQPLSQATSRRQHLTHPTEGSRKQMLANQTCTGPLFGKWLSGFRLVRDLYSVPSCFSPNPEPSPEDPPSSLAEADFEAMLEDIQPRLRGYIASILGGWSDVDDLVQDTNLVLNMKRDTFHSGTNFIAWAFRVAFFKATTWRRDKSHAGRVVVFSDSAFQNIAAAAEEYFIEQPPILEALSKCLQRLPDREREIITAKYVDRIPLVKLAAARGCGANSLHKAISRIRIALRKCVSETLEHENP